MNREKVTVYDATGRDRLSIHAWGLMCEELWQSRELIHRLVMRNIAGAFRQSFLGYFWIALPPIATTIVFTLLRRAQIVNVPMEHYTMPYALFALIGATIWGLFAQITNATMGSIAGAGALVSKIYFPREVLALAAVGNSLVNGGIRVLVIICSFALFRYVPNWEVILAPLILIPMIAFAIGLGLIFAPINTMMRDMSQMVNFVFQFGMFLAPTVYPTPLPAEIETAWQQALYWIHTLNPVTHFIHAVHNLIEHGQILADPGLYAATIVGLVTLALGWRFFHICEPLLAERL